MVNVGLGGLCPIAFVVLVVIATGIWFFIRSAVRSGVEGSERRKQKVEQEPRDETPGGIPAAASTPWKLSRQVGTSVAKLRAAYVHVRYEDADWAHIRNLGKRPQ